MKYLYNAILYVDIYIVYDIDNENIKVDALIFVKQYILYIHKK